MRLTGLNQIVVAVGISAVALVGLSAMGGAGPQDDQKQQQGKKEQPQNKANARASQEQARQQQAQRTQDAIWQQQQQLVQYREHLDQQQRLAQPQAAQLRQQRRTALAGVQQQYVARLRQQQTRVQNSDRYNFGRDPFFWTPPTVRYSRGGAYYETNQYGVNLLRQAVNYGYEEGIRVGMADRQDRWASNYEGSWAYQDANYGYSGFYVGRNDYNTYFREGFRRGYEDGYHSRHQFGTYTRGRGTVLGAVLATILNFQAIR
jgi:hypothetical protein